MDCQSDVMGNVKLDIKSEIKVRNKHGKDVEGGMIKQAASILGWE